MRYCITCSQDTYYPDFVGNISQQPYSSLFQHLGINIFSLSQYFFFKYLSLCLFYLFVSYWPWEGGALQVPGVPQDGATAPALAGTHCRLQRWENTNARGNCGTTLWTAVPAFAVIWTHSLNSTGGVFSSSVHIYLHPQFSCMYLGRLCTKYRFFTGETAVS